MQERCVKGAKSRLPIRVIVVKGWLHGAVAVTLGCLLLTGEARAKTPGTIHCYGGWCHRVSTIDEMHTMVGQRGYLRASYYDDCRIDRFNACGLTSSGEVFRPDQADNAASPIFPDGTVLLAYNPENGNAAVLRVNSTGPYRGDRRLDVSRATAEKLGFKKKGVADLAVTVISSPEPEDARYQKLRAYTGVPGYIGTFKNFDAAHDAALVSLKMQLETQTAALDDGLDPALLPENPRAVIASMPRLDVSAIPVRDFVFASQPEGSARTSEIVHIGRASEPETLSEPMGATVREGPRPADTMESVERVVIAAIDHSSSIGPLGQQEFKIVQESDATHRGLIKIGASFDGTLFTRLTAFVEAARAEARLKNASRAAAGSLQQLSWSERLFAFAQDARFKARASVVQGGAIQRFTAELTLKARRYR